MKRFRFLAGGVELGPYLLAARALRLARVGEFLAQPFQLAPGLVADPFGVRPLDLLTGGGDELDPAGGAQDVRGRRHVQRVGGGGRGTALQCPGQLRLGVPELLRDASAEDGVRLHRRGHRVAA